MSLRRRERLRTSKKCNSAHLNSKIFCCLYCGVVIMDEKIARLRAHQRNVERYEGLLKSNLSPTELRFVEQRLSEERFALALLQFMGPSSATAKIELPDALQ